MRERMVSKTKLLRELVRRTDDDADIHYVIRGKNAVGLLGIICVDHEILLYDLCGSRVDFWKFYDYDEFEYAEKYIVNYLKECGPEAEFDIYDAEFTFDTRLPKNQEELDEILGEKYKEEVV